MKEYTKLVIPTIEAQMEKEGIELWKLPSGRMIGNCPLCDDNTKSMMINPERQVFVCDKCNKGGQLVTFLKYFKGFTRTQAEIYLERQAIVAIEKEKLEISLRMDKGDE